MILNNLTAILNPREKGNDMKPFVKILCLSTILALSGCSDGAQVFSSNVSGGTKQVSPHAGGYYKIGNPYQVSGVWYHPKEDYTYEEIGIASWYGPDFHNGITANGELYDMHALTAAHRTLPLPSVVRVTNLQNNRSIILRVNDRGPFSNNRIIDVSMYAAQMLGFKEQGTVQVQVEILPEESKRLKAELIQKGKATSAGLNEEDADLFISTKDVSSVQEEAPSTQTNYPRLANPPQESSKNVTPLIPSATKPKESEFNSWDNDLSNAQAQKTMVEPKSLVPAPVATAQTPSAPVKESPKKTSLVSDIKSGYYIQVGAFGSLDNANNLKEKISSFGNSLIMPVSVNQKTLYRVRIGPETAKKALEIMDNMTKSGYPDARLVEEKGPSSAGQRLERAF